MSIFLSSECFQYRAIRIHYLRDTIYQVERDIFIYHVVAPALDRIK